MAGFKREIVFTGNRNMSKKDTIAYAKQCLVRVYRGDVAAMHDLWFIVNVLGVFPEEFNANPEKIANNPYFRSLETLV